MNRTGTTRRGPAAGRTRHAEDVTSITGAPEPLSDDIARRTQRYLLQMSIRVVCFIGAVLVDHWTRWLLLVGAVVLPYIAVLLANAGRERVAAPDPFSARLELPAAPRHDGLPGGRAAGDRAHGAHGADGGDGTRGPDAWSGRP